LLAHGRWFSPGTPASSTTKTGRPDIAEILLKVALKHQKLINQSNRNQEIEIMTTKNSTKPLLLRYTDHLQQVVILKAIKKKIRYSKVYY